MTYLIGFFGGLIVGQVFIWIVQWLMPLPKPTAEQLKSRPTTIEQ